eukprot:m.111352 g.111352  ORF g.111352 m.111352 type:complete len:123 (+) comp28115_c0_seq1:221-589(+)
MLLRTPTTVDTKYSYTNVSVTNNTFVLPADSAVNLLFANDSRVTGNHITTPCYLARLLNANDSTRTGVAIYIANANGSVVDGNTVEDTTHMCSINTITHSTMLGVGAHTANIVFDGEALPPT